MANIAGSKPERPWNNCRHAVKENRVIVLGDCDFFCHLIVAPHAAAAGERSESALTALINILLKITELSLSIDNYLGLYFEQS